MSRYTDWRAELAIRGYPEVSVPESTFYKRVRALRRDGFLDFEVAHFASASIGSPGMRAMRKERRRWYMEAIEDGVDKDEWHKRVTRKYKRNNWIFPETSSIAGAYDPWELLEHTKDKRGMRKTPGKKQRSEASDYDDVLDRALRR